MSRLQAQDDAARWIIRREDANWSSDDEAQFEAWMAQSDSNKAAYWRLKHSWSEADRIGSLGVETRPVNRRFRIAGVLTPLAVAASLAIMVAAVSFHDLIGQRQANVPLARYDTPVGGRRTIALPDGSRIELNTRTVVRAAVNKTVRGVWLDSGEAFFSVVHDPAHPFVVIAGAKRITVLGTKFSVRRERDSVIVSVVQGRVRIDDLTPKSASGGTSATVSAGAMAVTAGASTLVVQNAPERVTDSLAWRAGMLKFDQAPLADVAAEFNRYNRRQILVTDPAAASIRIGGVFQASNVDAFARLLHDAYGLQVASHSNEIKISS